MSPENKCRAWPLCWRTNFKENILKIGTFVRWCQKSKLDWGRDCCCYEMTQS